MASVVIEPASAAERRWDSLDALRGIAAFLVLTFHCSQVSRGFGATTGPLMFSTWLEPWAWFKFTPLRLLVSSGPAAVVLFFGLSGFVLSLPFLRRGKHVAYSEFAIRRVCRIYPPFAAAILISAALYAAVQPVPIPTLSQWFNDVLWTRPLSPDYVLRNLMMTGLHQDMTLDLVMWSLVHELRISFLFPLLFVLTRRWPAATMAASLGMGAACTAALAGAEATNLATSLVDTGRFVFLFVFGIVIAGRVDGIRRVVARLPRGIAGLLWIASIVLILAPGPSVSDYYNFVWGAGAIILIFLTVGSVRADRLLCMPPLLWLGRISYSLYLIHVPLLIASVHITDGILPTWITVLGVIPLSLACGGLMHRLVEEPSIRLGRHLTRKHRRLSDLPLAPTLSATRRLP